MGAYLSEPETKKISSDEAGKNVAFGASSMQGWRVNQEDAHNCCINFDENVSLFAVYDGHGGHEVATYCSQKLPEFIKNTDAYKNGDIEKALIDAFLGFDATLADPEIVLTLKKIAGTAVTDKEQVDSCDSSEEDTITNLRKEAEMPLEQVMLKYQTESMGSVKSNKIISSPFIRCRRAKAGCSSSSASSSGAGCSSSWNTNEGDVSSSSSSATPATSEEKKEDSKKPDLPGSSDSDQVLDSTSNGDGPHTSTTNAPDATKISQLPDSSEDVDDNSSNKISSNSEVNGEKEKKNAVNAGPDSSKNDNVSSSCSSLGNGDAGQQEGISSSSKKNQNENIYKNLLQKAIDNSEDESDSDDDDDDENDETFCSGEPEGSDEDEDEELEEEEDYSELDDDDDDDDDEEIDDEDGEPILTDEPGVDSGCTAVVAVLKGTELYVANAGDSRCVLCRDGEAIELSLDHKPEDEPEMTRIVKAGGKVTSDGRVNGGLNLSRALGDHAYKQNTALPPAEQMISALPDIKKITIDPKRDEFMILACDGIWNFMSSGEVVKYVRERLKKHESLSKICEELFDHCLAPDTLGDGTGCDNMTAVIVKFNETLGQEVKNNGDAEGMSVARKRAMSPTEEEKKSDENSGEAVKNDLPIEECKRAKMEAV